MGNDDKSFPDDDEVRSDTASRQLKKLQDMGVLDKPSDGPKAFGGTTTIMTHPFVKTKKSGRIGQLFEWFKKN